MARLMNTESLHAFVTVANLQSFSRAAETLHLSQSAISKRIAALEQHLKARVFDRIGHKTKLTETGRQLYPRARQILFDLEDSQRLISTLDQVISGPLILGASHHIGLHRLPPILKRYSQLYPDVYLEIAFLDSEQGCQKVAAGELELALVTLPLDPSPTLHCQAVWEDALVPVVSREHELARLRKPGLAQLGKVRAILPGVGTFTRILLEQRLRDLGIKVTTGLSTNYLETIKMLVEVGLGWSLLPTTMIDQGLKILKVPQLNFSRQLGLVRHQELTLSNPAKALIRLIQS